MLPAVTKFLPFAVASYCVWMLGPVPPPVVRIPSSPLSGAVAADVAVFGIGRDLLPVVVGATLTLANSFTAGRLKN